jgi:hypothetical protein
MKITKQLLREMIEEELMTSMEPALYPQQMPTAHVVDPHGYEGRMSKQNLFKIAEYANKLQQIIADNENLEPWVQEKIAVAADMMDSVGHYMIYEKMKPQE